MHLNSALRRPALRYFGADFEARPCGWTGWTPAGQIVYGERMINSKLIDDLARQISGSLPAGLRELQHDLEKNTHTILQNTLSKLDLVTREEFDVQSRVLARTREKLEQLEKAVAELEAAGSRDSGR
jgi:hypothetical protein